MAQADGVYSTRAPARAKPSKSRHQKSFPDGTQNPARASAERSLATAYIYEIRVDGVLRYIGKGRNGRVYSHLKQAKCTDRRCGVDTDHLAPHFHRKLVDAIRSGSTITEKIVLSDLSDREAYRIEDHMIKLLHKHCSGQLWNTIDERFMDMDYLPEEWNDPVCPIYRLPRPLKKPNNLAVFAIAERRRSKMR